MFFNDLLKGDWGFPTVYGSPYPFMTPLTQAYRWSRSREEKAESWRGGDSTSLRVWLVGTRHTSAEFLYIITHTVKGEPRPGNSGEVFSRPILAREFTEQLGLKNPDGTPLYETLFLDSQWLQDLSAEIQAAWKSFDDNLVSRGGIKLIDTRGAGFSTQTLDHPEDVQSKKTISGFPEDGGLEPVLSLWWIPVEHRMEVVWSRNGDRITPVRHEYPAINPRVEFPAAYSNVLFKDSLHLPVLKTRIQDDRFLEGFLTPYNATARRGHESDGGTKDMLLVDLLSAKMAAEGLIRLKWIILKCVSDCVFHDRNLIMGILARGQDLERDVCYMIHLLKNGKCLAYTVPKGKTSRMLENDLKLNRSSAAVIKLMGGNFNVIAENPNSQEVLRAVEGLKIQGAFEVIDG